jgi:hypothetical protein
MDEKIPQAIQVHNTPRAKMQARKRWAVQKHPKVSIPTTRAGLSVGLQQPENAGAAVVAGALANGTVAAMLKVTKCACETKPSGQDPCLGLGVCSLRL